jgi:hypothetical protein
VLFKKNICTANQLFPMLKKVLYLLLLFFAVTWFACKKVDIQFGDQFLDNGYTQIIKIDSFAAELSTVYVDSFTTSASGAAMIGGYTDAVFGKINTSTYFEFAPPTYVDSFAGTTFDSIALIVQPTGTYIGDTTKPIHIEVNRLAEAIVPYDNNATLLFNTNSFNVMPALLGSKNVVVRPTTGEPLSIKLDDNFGKDLLRKFGDPNDADVKTADAFLQYFYGLRVSSATNSAMIFNCKDSAVIRVYYKKPGLYTENRTLDFILNNSAHQFNHVDIDRSAAVLKDLPAKKEIPSADLNNSAYTMFTGGAMVKMRFPSVREILKMPSYAKILKATLTVRPLRGSYGAGSYTLPPQMRLATTTQLNQIGADIYLYNSSGYVETLTGDLIVDELYGENTSYSYDVTAYIRSVVADASINGNGLLLLPPSGTYLTQFGRLAIGNRNNAGGKTELSIVYAAVQ